MRRIKGFERTVNGHAVAQFTVLLLLFGVLGPVPASGQVDLSGEWANRIHEDQPDRGPGPEIADFTGLPLNEASRARGLSWNASLMTVPEQQCLPHPANYGPMHSNLRIWKEVDPASQKIVAWRMLFESWNRFRTIYMDGRPHPSEDALRTWQGFSTGRWVGNTLEITTTHMKESRIRRNGIDHSDQAVLIENLARHGDVLTYISILEDPLTLTEPYIQTRNFVVNPQQVIRPYPCRAVVEIERELGDIPHYLPGQNPFLDAFAEKFGLPLEAALGGAETIYPEYRERLKALTAGGGN